MEVEQLYELFAATIQPEQQVRNNAEKLLKQLEEKTGFLSSLLQIATRNDSVAQAGNTWRLFDCKLYLYSPKTPSSLYSLKTPSSHWILILMQRIPLSRLLPVSRVENHYYLSEKPLLSL